jgi:hypothetical protein
MTEATLLPPQWDERLLLDFVRFWNRQRYFGGLSFEEYRAGEQHQDRLLDVEAR